MTQVRALLDAVRSRREAAQANRDAVIADLKDTRVYVPSSGTIITKLVEEGEVVSPGAPLAVLVDLSRLHLKVYLPESEIGEVRIGDPARVYVDAFPGRFFEAEVTEVSQQAEFTPRDIHMKDERVRLVFGVKLGLKSPEGYLKPGMPADARIRWKGDSPWGDGL